MYVELHCHSNFSFLDGASHVEELVLQAKALGYPALALTDHNGLYGAMEFARAARAWEIQPITGAEVTLASGHHLTLLAETREGYANLCRMLTRSHLDNERLNPSLDPELLKTHSAGLIALSGCRNGEVPSLIGRGQYRQAVDAALEYMDLFGAENFYIELQRNLADDDEERVEGLVRLARDLGLPLVATNNVHYHLRYRARLQDVLVAIKNRSTLESSHRVRRPNSEFFLKSSDQMSRLFSDIPEAIENTVRVAERCRRFDLTTDLHYEFPEYGERGTGLLGMGDWESEESPSLETKGGGSVRQRRVTPVARIAPQNAPPLVSREGTGEGAAFGCSLQPTHDNLQTGSPLPDPDSLLRHHCTTQIRERYEAAEWSAAGERLEQELRLIEKHKLAGFFLIYRDILELGKEIAKELYGEHRDRAPGRGRGSSVGSIVCYLIGLSPIDPLRANLYLGRFLNEDLATVPDIDLDFSREVRERLILKVYEHFGEEHVALVCSFPTYRLRSAVREIGKALGLPEAELARLAKLAGSHGSVDKLGEEMQRYPEFTNRIEAPLWRDLIDLAAQAKGFPRHISQHVGGMIISSTPIVEIVPLEQSAMEGRIICQWDKDSCDDARMVKIDFLGLGMLSLVDYCLDEIVDNRGYDVDLTRIDYADEAVFDMICAGDTVGVFQIESRAQMQTLPRTRPRNLDDLTVEVAIIRPGPIVGGAVNPYIKRRQGREPVSYDHPSLEPFLEETLGVILFQEQVIQVAMAITGITAGQADQFRRAMSRKRSREAMESMRVDFYQRAIARGVDADTAEVIFNKLVGFAEFGFPKSHSAAFALLAYQSSWLKFYYPVEFTCALLNAQPMGFYSSEVIIRDARRHGVSFRQPDINASRRNCTVEGESVRIGFQYVKGVGPSAAEAIEQARDETGEFRSIREFLWRTGTSREAVENLIRAGAFDSFGLNRRELLWQLGLVYRPPSRQLPLPLPTKQDEVRLNDLSRWERVVTDFEVMGFSTYDHPMAVVRSDLDLDLETSVGLEAREDGKRVRYAGMVVCRQRPETAGGFTFMTLEDEFGLANLIVRPKVLERFRTVIRSEPFLTVAGQLQIHDGTTNIVVADIEPLPIPPELMAPPSHNYR
ncbi:MAG: DNA polymerase III subunit alpha [Thermomicrobiales bacterium]